MAKETKQDRVVRNMYDQTMEHLHELKTIESSPTSKEMDVERWAQSFLKSCLGYTASSGYSIKAQETKGKMRPDLIVLKNDKPVFVVEVKKSGFDLNKSDFRSGKTQLSEYLNTLGGVKYGILTNGCEWRIYDFSQPQFGGIEISGFNLKSDGETIDCSKKTVEDLCYEIVDFHETSFSASLWQDLSKEALAFSPESLARAILSSDVVKYIAKSIKGEHEYRANSEVLTDKLYWLLEQGLNDAITGWNETKSLEFDKYIKSQKRASRKVKRPSKRDSVDTGAGPTPADSPTPVAAGPTEASQTPVSEPGKKVA